MSARQIEVDTAHDPDRDARVAEILTAAPATLPTAGSKAAWDAYGAACHEHTLRTQFANDYPDLHRDTSTWWTQRCLGRALETGDITPMEAARLFPLASERELRMAQVEHELNMGALHALAFADQYPFPADDEFEAEPGADAELIRLGRKFQAAAAREIEACAAINAAAAEAKRHEPAFPACLTLTAADHELNVYQHWTHPEALEGITLGGADVDWLRRRMPMTHEVLRPIREGERAHIDHPGRKFDIVPHPEAQARAEEIVAAYDVWRIELRRVHDEYVAAELETAADAAGEIAAAIASEIAALPACTADGFRVKLRALLHYERDALTAELPELPDPDQILGHSIRQDVLRDGIGAETEAPGDGGPTGQPDPIFAPIEVSRRAEAEMQAFQQEARCPIAAFQSGQEDALEAAQIAASKAVWATVPKTWAGRLALVEYARFQAKLYYGADWQAKARSDGAAGDIALALMAAIEAERPEAPPPPAEKGSNLTSERAWAVEQAAAVDLSGLTVLHLCNLFECFAETSDRWLDIMHSGWARNDCPGGFLDLNVAGDLASREHERAAEIRTRIAGEIERRTTADHWERDQRLEVLIRYELLCNGNLRHAPELRAEMARAWGA